MKKKVVIGLIFMFSTVQWGICSGQLSLNSQTRHNKPSKIMPWQEYATETGNEDYDFILLFLPNQHYRLTFEFSDPKFPDQPEAFIISTGSYQWTGNRFSMTDNLWGFHWDMQLQNEGLVINSGFPCMDKKVLTYYRTADESNPYIDVKFDYRSRLAQAKSIPQPYNSLSKSYSWNYFKLYLENDHTYRLLHHGKVVISEGAWSREGNILTITDSALKTPFYGIILPDGLESMLLPGLYRGPVLNKYEIARSSLVRQE